MALGNDASGNMVMPVSPLGNGAGGDGSYEGNGGMSNRGYSRGNNVTDGLRELMYAAPPEMQGEINRLIKKLDNM